MSSTTSTSSASLYAIPTITSYINVGPMPTAITFPPNCRSDVYDFGENGVGLLYTYYTQGCALSSCCPSSLVYSSAFEWYSYYFSPAVCPYGYTQGPIDPIISSASGENARWCCPTDFDQLAASPYPTPATTPYYNWLCQREYYNLSSTAYVYDNVFDQKFLSTETINSYFYAAFPIQIRWKEGDFDNIATITATSSAESSSSPLVSTSASSPAIISTGPSNHSLSTGAIAAIAVVVGLLSLTAVAFGVLWFRRRSQKRATLLNTSMNHQYDKVTQKDLHEKDSRPIPGALAYTDGNHELDAIERVELDAGGPAELDAH